MYRVRHRPHNLTVSLDHQSPAYLDENYPIVINITNTDDRELDIVIDILLQPTEIDGASKCFNFSSSRRNAQHKKYQVNTISFGDDHSTSFIKGISFGTIPSGVTAVQTLCFLNTGAPGDRVIDISIQSRSTSPDVPSDDPDLQDITETLRTLVVPTLDPLKVTQTVVYMRGLVEWPGPADLRTFDGDFWDDRKAGEALINTRIECTGPSSMEIESVRLLRQVSLSYLFLNHNLIYT